MCTYLYTIIGTVVISVLLSLANSADENEAKSNDRHVPSLHEIAGMKNRDLNDIFRQIIDNHETRPPEPVFSSNLNVAGKRESFPIERDRGFEEVDNSNGQQNRPSPYSVGEELGKLARSGAEVFVSGARQLGVNLGISTDQISSEFLRAGKAFLGG